MSERIRAIFVSTAILSTDIPAATSCVARHTLSHPLHVIDFPTIVAFCARRVVDSDDRAE